jgi:hypothetical protein
MFGTISITTNQFFLDLCASIRTLNLGSKSTVHWLHPWATSETVQAAEAEHHRPHDLSTNPAGTRRRKRPAPDPEELAAGSWVSPSRATAHNPNRRTLNQGSRPRHSCVLLLRSRRRRHAPVVRQRLGPRPPPIALQGPSSRCTARARLRLRVRPQGACPRPFPAASPCRGSKSVLASIPVRSLESLWIWTASSVGSHAAGLVAPAPRSWLF